MAGSAKKSGAQYHTSEAVAEGHPDKIADQIADATLDAILQQDPGGRVAVEVLLTGRNVVIAGEVTTTAKFNVESIARGVITDVGYTDPKLGFDAQGCRIDVALQQQSPNIGNLVGKRGERFERLGAGDQGIMYGYATDETQELMPLPIVLANRLVKQLAKVRKSRVIPYLRPDGKSQVTVEYQDGKPKRIHTIVISAQHDPDVKLAHLRKDVARKVIRAVIPNSLLDHRTRFLINRKGSFVIGGPVGDTGLTGRKVIVDTYGGVGSHGGGSFSGKDPTKVDRSASYAARWAAKNLVAAGLCREVEVQLAYAIGLSRPLAINVASYGTSQIPDAKLLEIVAGVFDFRPGVIIKNLQLRRPIYRQLSVYGHFGRSDLDLPWERLDKVREIRSLASSLV